MDLGSRIKQARLEAGLSQRQLCGDTITRNMLSQIENGAARPSMDTLRILASRLGRPLSWFLEEDAVTSPNRERMDAARKAFETGQWQAVLDALEDFRRPDETFAREASLLQVLALTALAEEAILDGRLPYAIRLLQQADAPEGAYCHLNAEKRQLLLAKAGADVPLPDCTEVLLLQARRKLSAGDAGGCLAVLGGCSVSEEFHLLTGLALCALGSFAAAIPHLSAAEEAFPREVIPRLEDAYRETGDFRNAYEYARKRRDN